MDSVNDCIDGAIEEMEELGYSRSDVKCIGITNQRETTLAWDRQTGEPFCNAIVWDDSRTASEVHAFQRKLDETGIELVGKDAELDFSSAKGFGEGVCVEREVRDDKGGTRKARFLMGTDGLKALSVPATPLELTPLNVDVADPFSLPIRTGLPLSTYFSAIKARWMIDTHPEIRQADADDRLCFGTVDSWLVYNLTGGPDQGGLHVIDVSNASRTLLCTLETVSWSPSLLQWFGFKESMLPEIRSSSEVYGTCFEGPLEGVPISGIAGDQQAALVGQKCLTLGMAKATFGTVRLSQRDDCARHAEADDSPLPSPLSALSRALLSSPARATRSSAADTA